MISATGVLDLTALSADSKPNINLWSLASTGPYVNGAVPGFDNTQGCTWKIATAAGDITGLNTSCFNLIAGAVNGSLAGLEELAAGARMNEMARAVAVQ